MRLMQRVKIAKSFFSLCQICSTSSFEAFLCSSTHGCQRILKSTSKKEEIGCFKSVFTYRAVLADPEISLTHSI